MCRLVHSPIVSSIRFVRFRKAPVIPRQEIANTGPTPFFVTTTSTILVLSPPRMVFSAPSRRRRRVFEGCHAVHLIGYKRWVREHFMWTKTAFQNEAAADIPVDWLDMSCALRLCSRRSKFPKGFLFGKPFANRWFLPNFRHKPTE